MKAYQKKYNAFTLIELMVVIAIIGIMTAIGFGVLQNQKSPSALTDAQRQVASAIKLAQSYALQGKAVNGTTPCGFGFRFTNSTNYEIFDVTPQSGNDCDQTNTNYTAGNLSSSEAYSLDNGVTIASVNSNPLTTDFTPTEIYFTVPNGIMYDSSGTGFSAKTFQFDLGSSNNKTITVNSGGSITEN